jgi:ABC-type multidrug transport system ATPase subunit
MYQRLGIARALIKEPSVVLLDEPTRSLDPASAAHFWNLARDLPLHGTTVLLATHTFSEAVAVGDQVVVLHAGRVAGQRKMAGTNVEELRTFYFRTTGETDEMTQVIPGIRK